MIIKIGADELILWLRKNNIANNIPNDDIQGLGSRIRKTIESLGGKKVEENAPVYWPIPEKNGQIDKYKLPKTSAQYEIDIDCLSDIYKELSKL